MTIFTPPAGFIPPAEQHVLNTPVRHLLYQHALQVRGLTARTPFRTLAALTTGLPGEIVELALTMEDGQHFKQRCCPNTGVTPGARQMHGLSHEDLERYPPCKAGFTASRPVSRNPESTVRLYQ